jgi:hypothetical protein
MDADAWTLSQRRTPQSEHLHPRCGCRPAEDKVLVDGVFFYKKSGQNPLFCRDEVQPPGRSPAALQMDRRMDAKKAGDYVETGIKCKLVMPGWTKKEKRQ